MHPDTMKLNVPEDWQPFDEVYFAFCEANPMLGLNPTEDAAVRLRSLYAPQLEAWGAATKLPNRRWLADPRRFGPALLKAMRLRRADILARGAARGGQVAPAPESAPAP